MPATPGEGSRYDGMLTEEIVGRAMDELRALADDLASPDASHSHGWLVAWEGRIGNALADLAVVRDRFRKAQT